MFRFVSGAGRGRRGVRRCALRCFGVHLESAGGLFAVGDGSFLCSDPIRGRAKEPSADQRGGAAQTAAGPPVEALGRSDARSFDPGRNSRWTGWRRRHRPAKPAQHRSGGGQRKPAWPHGAPNSRNGRGRRSADNAGPGLSHHTGSCAGRGGRAVARCRRRAGGLLDARFRIRPGQRSL